jgi:hypothetical protein
LGGQLDMHPCACKRLHRYGELQGSDGAKPLVHAMAVVAHGSGSEGGAALLWACDGSGGGSITRLDDGAVLRKVGASLRPEHATFSQ